MLSVARREHICGVYMMGCSGKVYIGSSRNCLGRWKVHFDTILAGKSPYTKDFKASATDGSLVFFLLERCSIKQRLMLEEKWATKFPLRINRQKRVSKFDTVEAWTPEVRQKLSRLRKGIKLRAETRAKMSRAQIGNKNAVGGRGFTGRKHSESSLEKLKIAARNRPPVTLEFRQHLRSIAGNRKGAHLSLETKEKLRKAQILVHLRKRGSV